MNTSSSDIMERAKAYIDARLPPPPEDWVEPELPPLKEGEPEFRNMTKEELMESQRFGY